MKILGGIFFALFIVLQYQLWFTKGSVFDIWRMKKSIAVQKKQNLRSDGRNAIIVADVHDLKNGNQAIEERARNELGMIKKDEVFYEVVK